MTAVQVTKIGQNWNAFMVLLKHTQEEPFCCTKIVFEHQIFSLIQLLKLK